MESNSNNNVSDNFKFMDRFFIDGVDLIKKTPGHYLKVCEEEVYKEEKEKIIAELQTIIFEFREKHPKSIVEKIREAIRKLLEKIK